MIHFIEIDLKTNLSYLMQAQANPIPSKKKERSHGQNIVRTLLSPRSAGTKKSRSPKATGSNEAKNQSEKKAKAKKERKNDGK